jgi:hypothetical protein
MPKLARVYNDGGSPREGLVLRMSARLSRAGLRSRSANSYFRCPRRSRQRMRTPSNRTGPTPAGVALSAHRPFTGGGVGHISAARLKEGGRATGRLKDRGSHRGAAFAESRVRSRPKPSRGGSCVPDGAELKDSCEVLSLRRGKLRSVPVLGPRKQSPALAWWRRPGGR